MRARLLVFVIGVLVGAVGAVLLPSRLRPYIPKRMIGAATAGEVAAKGREGDQLLLTVLTDEGATLATFSDKVAEIDLLVEVGDRVSLGLGGYRPFVEDPPIWRVEKPQLERPTSEQEIEPVDQSPEVPSSAGEPPPAGAGISGELESGEEAERPEPPPSG